MATEHEYQSKVTHRVRLTIPVIVEVEVIRNAANEIAAVGEAVKAISDGFNVAAITDRYTWKSAHIDKATIGAIQHVMMTLKPVPAEVVEPTPEDTQS